MAELPYSEEQIRSCIIAVRNALPPDTPADLAMCIFATATGNCASLIIEAGATKDDVISIALGTVVSVVEDRLGR